MQLPTRWARRAGQLQSHEATLHPSQFPDLDVQFWSHSTLRRRCQNRRMILWDLFATLLQRPRAPAPSRGGAGPSRDLVGVRVIIRPPTLRPRNRHPSRSC